MTDSVNISIIDKAICRISLTTPGLLIIVAKCSEIKKETENHTYEAHQSTAMNGPQKIRLRNCKKTMFWRRKNLS